MHSSNGTAPGSTGGSGKRIHAHVTGWGRYVPAQILSNKDLERMVDTSDEWIVSRTGISERRVAAAHETTASMGAVAALRAIHAAGEVPFDECITVAPLRSMAAWPGRACRSRR